MSNLYKRVLKTMSKSNRLRHSTAVACLLLATSSAHAGSLTTLYTFTGGSDGAKPFGVTVRADGTVFGETVNGGDVCSAHKLRAVQTGCGTTYRLDPDLSFQTLVTFNGGFKGATGFGPVSLNGDLVYGSTYHGGDDNNGLVFSVTNQGLKFEALHRFDGSDGSSILASNLQVDPNGNVFGVTYLGGTSNYGVLFEILRDGTYKILHNFSDGTDGARPSSIVLDPSGIIYGTTNYTPSGCQPTAHVGPHGCGEAYSFDPVKGIFTVLYNFKGFYSGAFPVLGGESNDGSLFGVTTSGGTGGSGTLFELRKAASGYVYRLLHTFTGGSDGASPNPPFVDPHGVLTGSASYNNVTKKSYGTGVLYQFSGGTFTLLYTFAGGSGSFAPLGRIQPDKAGNFYGATASNGTQPCVTSNGTEISTDGCGTIWKYTP